MVNYKFDLLHDSINKSDLELINEIKKIRQTGNLQTIRKKMGDEKLSLLLNHLYPKYALPQMEKILGVPDSSLGHWFKQLGIQTVRRNVDNFPIAANFEFSLVLPTKNGATNFLAMKIDEDLAYLMGFCIGDGAIQKYMVEAFNKDYGMKEYLRTTMKKYGTVQDVTRPDGLWKLRLSSIKIAGLIKRKGKIVEDSLDYVLSDDLLAPRFLAGVWDAEGSVLKQDKYIHVYIYNSNKDLLDTISSYLSNHKIKNSIIKVKKRKEPYFYKGHKIIAKKQIYRIGIPKSHLKKWKELIGLYLKHSKKSAVVLEI